MKKKEKPVEAFVERQQEETQSNRSRRISLRVNEEGAIDWSQMSDKQKEMFFETISNDPDVLERVAGAVGDGEGGEAGLITEDHVKWFLSMYAKGEAWAIPAYIKKQSKGLVVIPPKVAEEVYSFSEKELESMGPDGAQFANESIIPNLPEWMKGWIVELGPGAKFIGALMIHTVMKTQALTEWLKTQPRTVDAAATVPNAAQPVNGHAAATPEEGSD